MALQFVFANNAGSTLAGPINNVTTAINVASGGGAIFPNPTVGTQQFAATIIDAATGLRREIVYVTAVSIDTFTVLRAQESTAAQNWLAGDLIQELWTAGQCAVMVQSLNIFAPSNTFYVNGTTGNDTNPGTNALPFKTIQACINSVIGLISQNAITINVAAGTYAGFTISNSQISAWNIVGSGTGTCTISSTTSAVNSGRGVIVFGSQLNITGFTITALVDCIAARQSGAVTCYNVNFIGTANTSYALTASNGASIQFLHSVGNTTQNVTSNISGSFNSIFLTQQSGSILMGYNDPATSTVCNLTINFSAGTVAANGVTNASSSSSISLTASHVSFTGSTPTGQKFIVSTAAGVVGAAGIPGSAGTTTSPGWTA